MARLAVSCLSLDYSKCDLELCEKNLMNFMCGMFKPKTYISDKVFCLVLVPFDVLARTSYVLVFPLLLNSFSFTNL